MSDNVTRRGFIGAAGAAAGGMLLAGAEGQAQAAEGRKKLKIIAVSCSRREGASTAGGLKIIASVRPRRDVPWLWTV